MAVMSLPANLAQLSADELRRLLVEKDRELDWRQAKIDKLTHELALHKRWRFGVKTEQWPVEQRQLFEETIDADLAAMEEELAQEIFNITDLPIPNLPIPKSFATQTCASGRSGNFAASSPKVRV